MTACLKTQFMNLSRSLKGIKPSLNMSKPRTSAHLLEHFWGKMAYINGSIMIMIHWIAWDPFAWPGLNVAHGSHCTKVVANNLFPSNSFAFRELMRCSADIIDVALLLANCFDCFVWKLVIWIAFSEQASIVEMCSLKQNCAIWIYSILVWCYYIWCILMLSDAIWCYLHFFLHSCRFFRFFVLF